MYRIIFHLFKTIPLQTLYTLSIQRRFCRVQDTTNTYFSKTHVHNSIMIHCWPNFDTHQQCCVYQVLVLSSVLLFMSYINIYCMLFLPFYIPSLSFGPSSRFRKLNAYIVFKIAFVRTFLSHCTGGLLARTAGLDK
jgi:hypothetical protein